MSDGKDYIVRPDELGNINISEDVIATIAALTVNEIPGVGGLVANIGVDIAELLGKKNLSRGVKIEVSEENVSIDIYVLVKYGYTVLDVAKGIQDSVSGAVESTTGLKVSCVNVHVSGITFDKEKKASPEK
jgi:uncharacterized alkaline shock family protein YloU